MDGRGRCALAQVPVPLPGRPWAGGIAPASRSHVAFLRAEAQGPFHTVKDVLLSVNGGKTEHLTGQAPIGGGVSLGSLSYLSRTVGWVVVGEPSFAGFDQLLRKSDAGRTWHPVRS